MNLMNNAIERYDISTFIGFQFLSISICKQSALSNCPCISLSHGLAVVSELFPARPVRLSIRLHMWDMSIASGVYIGQTCAVSHIIQCFPDNWLCTIWMWSIEGMQITQLFSHKSTLGNEKIPFLNRRRLRYHFLGCCAAILAQSMMFHNIVT